MTKLAIIIVNWNTGTLLAECVQSLLDLPESEQALVSDVVIVDNASHDNSIEQARSVVSGQQQRLTVHFIENRENVGFAAANNQGVNFLREQRLDERVHVLLLNPDTRVRAGALQNMVEVLRERPDVGIVGPRLRNPNGSQQGSVRPFPQFGDFLLYMLKLGRVVQRQQENAYDYDTEQYVDQVMGAVFLIRYDVWQEIGLLDDTFFTLFEEVDYAKRARDAGWRSFYTPAAEVMHVRAASFNQLVGLRRGLPWLKSALHYARKHLATWQVVVLHVLFPLAVILTVLSSVKHLWLKYVRAS